MKLGKNLQELLLFVVLASQNCKTTTYVQQRKPQKLLLLVTLNQRTTLRVIKYDGKLLVLDIFISLLHYLTYFRKCITIDYDILADTIDCQKFDICIGF